MCIFINPYRAALEQRPGPQDRRQPVQHQATRECRQGMIILIYAIYTVVLVVLAANLCNIKLLESVDKVTLAHIYDIMYILPLPVQHKSPRECR
jgi:hypothetical protein